MPTYLFVYGTLKSTYQHAMHQSLLRYATYAGEGFFMGKLYRIDWYPGMVASDNEDDSVFGELYEVNNEEALFTLLDEYEDYRPNDESNSDYLRRKVIIDTNQEVVEAWTYLYNLSVGDLERLESGVF